VAVILAVVAMAMFTALGTGLVLLTSAEAMIAANFRAGHEARYAAGSIAEFALAHLDRTASWDDVLSGIVRSGFTDGLPVGERTLAGGTRIDLSRVTNLARCGRPAGCTLAEMNMATAGRPWGPNNPRWQMYAHGPFEALAGRPTGAPASVYVLAFVGDDGLETDGDPLRDGTDGPGAGVLLIRAEAFGASGSHAVIETTVGRREGDDRIRVLSWRQL
jgi:hypothetical protein